MSQVKKAIATASHRRGSQPAKKLTPPAPRRLGRPAVPLPSVYDLGRAHVCLAAEQHLQDLRALRADSDSAEHRDAYQAMENLSFQRDTVADLILSRPLPTMQDAAVAALTLWEQMERFSGSQASALGHVQEPSVRWRNTLARLTIVICETAGINTLDIATAQDWGLIRGHARQGVAP